MEIILMASTTGRVKQLRLRRWWLWAGMPTIGVGSLCLLLSVVWGVICYVPGAHEFVLSRLLDPSTTHQRSQSCQRNSARLLNEYVGRLQAELIRLQVEHAALVKRQGVAVYAAAEALGGPEPPSAVGLPLAQALGHLDHQLSQLQSATSQIQLWTALREQHALEVPYFQPLSQMDYSSNFGVRTDPFTRRAAVHDGVDFRARPGTPIRAAAGGRVTFASTYAGYGRMVELDHGAGMVSRYAHASKLLVKAGADVKKGDVIALVGSSGRSTGAHLHFEVRYRGAPKNPSRFLTGVH